MVGDAGRAVVIDPRRDVEVYLAKAREEDVAIGAVFETHRNEDYVSGALELAAATGAEIYHGKATAFEYGNPAEEGDSWEFGKARLEALETPGHTYDSLSFVLYDQGFGDTPLAVFTGDALFIGDVGRTDFFPEQHEEVVGLLYDSLFNKLLPLGDQVLLYPAHGKGSVCGAHMAEREFSTLGYERRENSQLQFDSREGFMKHKLQEQHTFPPYFRRMEQYNLEGPPLLAEAPEPVRLSAEEFAARQEEGMIVLDVRTPEAYGGAHIPGSLSMPLEQVPRYAGWLLPYDQPLGLVVEEASHIQTAENYLRRIGYDEIEAYLQEGMHDWETAGHEFEGVPQVYVGEIIERLEKDVEFTLLDVRSPEEWKRGHLPGATHVYLGHLPQKLEELPEARPITTFCGSGHRASIAASVLLRAGFEQVENCLGSLQACSARGCPLVRE
jgi:hydroxyacylglutathione hydrolase